jgi:CheY-like chemotaxis protein
LARKILLADDSVTAQNMGRKILADAGYEVITVNNGSAALKKIAELKPDLVILDVYMPGYSGLEVCQRLKESHDSARIPVLLTVGKLEPFKPEEAHRVRAEGFIVKPFEASELLSALSKLEDKVVPRAEPSKPGRFARTIAAVDEASRITRNDNPSDNGWKSRIAFPHEKTAEEKVDEDDTTYNPVNRDLRTLVERPAEKAVEQPATKPSQTPAPSVDVAALAPPGLPQDVTPQEVAPIAAAAAQIQMAATIRNEQPTPLGEASVTPGLPYRTDPASIETQVSLDTQATPPVADQQAQAEAPIANAEPENNSEVTHEASAAPTQSGRDSDPKSEESEDSEDLPVTMAAASQSTAAANGDSSRWTAVSVALEADDAMISLEQEMQKAYSAFVSEESASANPATALEIAPSQDIPAAAEAAAEPSANAVFGLKPEPLPQPEIAVVANASNPDPEPASQPNPDAAASSVNAEAAKLSQSTASPEQLESASVEPAPNEFPEASSAESSESSQPEPEPASEPVSAVAATPADGEGLPPTPPPEAASVETITSNYESAASDRESIEQAKEEEHREQEPKEDPETVKSTAAAWASWRQIRDTSDAKPETAEAARAPLEAPVPAPAESAAMAVAAGAEQNVQETAVPTPENPSDVASIVDSVLADLRPRLMAEITRKMSEKK